MHYKKSALAALCLALIGTGIFAATRGGDPAEAAPAPVPPPVAVARVGRADLARTVTLTAEMRPWQQIDIHAKEAGYLKTIGVDIGDAVTQGETIATLDLPEQQQDMLKAAADYDVAKLDYGRIATVIRKHPGLLAQQDVDDARGKYEEAKAAYERAKILADYATITAPFNGVVTARFADPGALVQAGTSSDTQALPLVHLAEIDRLRLDFPAPETIVPDMHTGMPVDITVQATGETIHSTIARMSDRVAPDTRTMNVEVDLDNSDRRLKPGMYADARVALDSAQNALVAPVQAVSEGGAPNVWVVDAHGVVEEKPVTLGIETPDRVEIKSGVAEGDMLIYGDRSKTGIGMHVTPKPVGLAGK